jgi:hypothetical protein
LKPVAPATEIYGHRAASPQQYMICGGYASLFFRLDFIGGLAYSSIATDCKGVNVALKGSVADQYVVPLSFRAFLVTEVSSPFDFRVRCVAAAGAPGSDGGNWMGAGLPLRWPRGDPLDL